MTRNGISHVLRDELCKSKMFARVIGLSPTILALSISGPGCISPLFREQVSWSRWGKQLESCGILSILHEPDLSPKIIGSSLALYLLPHIVCGPSAQHSLAGAHEGASQDY